MHSRKVVQIKSFTLDYRTRTFIFASRFANFADLVLFYCISQLKLTSQENSLHMRIKNQLIFNKLLAIQGPNCLKISTEMLKSHVLANFRFVLLFYQTCQFGFRKRVLQKNEHEKLSNTVIDYFNFIATNQKGFLIACFFF